MPTALKRKTSLTLDATALEDARNLGINVSAVADSALQRAVIEEKQRKWREENKEAFAKQAAWHERNGHPLAEIISSPAGSTWKA